MYFLESESDPDSSESDPSARYNDMAPVGERGMQHMLLFRNVVLIEIILKI